MVIAHFLMSIQTHIWYSLAAKCWQHDGLEPDFSRRRRNYCGQSRFWKKMRGKTTAM